MILDAYAAFRTALSIPFYTNNGFAVEIQKIVIDVAVSRSGMVTLSSYIGLTTNLAEQLCLELKTQGYKIWPEKYSGYYEIEIERSVPFTDIPSLHKKVTAMAGVVEAGYARGKEIIGEDFCR